MKKGKNDTAVQPHPLSQYKSIESSFDVSFHISFEVEFESMFPIELQ